MSFQKFILISLFAIVLFSGNVFPANKKNLYHKTKNAVSEKNEDKWALEFHDGKWWWVLYGEDGSRIIEIPADF